MIPTKIFSNINKFLNITSKIKIIPYFINKILNITK